MKNFNRCAIGIVGFFMTILCACSAWADSASKAGIEVSARVPSALTLNIRIIDEYNNKEKPSIDFGELERIGDEFRAKVTYKVLIDVNANGDGYEVRQLGSQLIRNGGSEAIPNNTYICRPLYQESENIYSDPTDAGLPPTAKVGEWGTTIGDKLLFDNPGGKRRTITTRYTLSGDPNTGASDIIPISQKSGSYSGTIQFTLTTKG